MKIMDLFRKGRQFNSRIYNLDFVKDYDEFDFLSKTLKSFVDAGVVSDLLTLTSESNRATIHVETKDKTLIKWLIKFGFEEA